MKLLSTLRLYGFTALVALASSACIFTVADGDDDDDSENDTNATDPSGDDACGINSQLNAINECQCNAGYDWCDPNLDPGPNGRHDCCVSSGQACPSGSNNVMVDDQCHCLAGFEWCSDNVNDLNCCVIENDTGTGTDTGDVSEHPMGACDPANDFAWCSHTVAQGPGGSTYYLCENGTWADRTNTLDGECVFEGFDFAYGCVFDDVTNPAMPDVRIECGEGPGTACDQNTPDSCSADETEFLFCEHGRVTAQNCVPADGNPCETANGEQFEFGKCGEQDGTVSCLCYDEELDETGTDGTDTGTGTDDTGTGTDDTSTD